jgi:hypothetical protein
MIDDWEIIEALLMAQGGSHEFGLSDEALFRFATGWCSVAEEEEALACLIRSESLRDRLIETRATIERQASQPVEALGNTPLDRTLRHLVTEALAAFQTPANESGAPVSRTVLRAIGISINERGLLPATVRSGGRTRFSVGPDGPSGTLSIEPGDGGFAYLVLRADPGTGLGVRPLVIVFDDGMSSTVIHEFFPFGREARIELHDLGLSPASVHPGMFRISHEVEESRWKNTIRAESLVSRGRRFRVRLAAMPRIEGSKLIVQPIIPEAMVAEAAAGLVELRMLVGTTSILLASQRVPSAEGPMRIEVDSFGAPEGTLPCGEFFSLSFRPQG